MLEIKYLVVTYFYLVGCRKIGLWILCGTGPDDQLHDFFFVCFFVWSFVVIDLC